MGKMAWMEAANKPITLAKLRIVIWAPARSHLISLQMDLSLAGGKLRVAVTESTVKPSSGGWWGEDQFLSVHQETQVVEEIYR